MKLSTFFLERLNPLIVILICDNTHLYMYMYTIHNNALIMLPWMSHKSSLQIDVGNVVL